MSNLFALRERLPPITGADEGVSSTIAVAGAGADADASGDVDADVPMNEATDSTRKQAKINPQIDSLGLNETQVNEMAATPLDTQHDVCEDSRATEDHQSNPTSTRFNFRSYMKAPRMVYRGHQKPILSLSSISAPGVYDDTLVLSAGEDKQIKIWSLLTGELVLTLKGHLQRISGISAINISRQEVKGSAIKTIESGSSGDALPHTEGDRGRESEERDCESRWTSHNNHETKNPEILTVMVTSSWDETVRIWDITPCFQHYVTRKESTVRAARSSRVGQTCAASAGLSSPQIFLPADISAISANEDKAVVLRGHKNRVYCVMTLPDGPTGGPTAASGSADNTVRVWSLPDGVPLLVLQKHEEITWNLCISGMVVPPVGMSVNHHQSRPPAAPAAHADSAASAMSNSFYNGWSTNSMKSKGYTETQFQQQGFQKESVAPVRVSGPIIATGCKVGYI